MTFKLKHIEAILSAEVHELVDIEKFALIKFENTFSKYNVFLP